MDASDRGRIMNRLADLMERDQGYLAVSSYHIFMLFTGYVLIELKFSDVVKYFKKDFFLKKIFCYYHILLTIYFKSVSYS